MPTKPRKVAEYNLFLDMLENGPVEHLNQIAEVLGVDPNTLSDWNKMPEVRKAKAAGIQKTLAEMEKVGKRDWRMWQAKAQMLGLAAPSRSDVTSGGEKITPIIDINALSANDRDAQTGQAQ